MPFLKSLNKLQHKAATHTRGPLLVLAGAGSGKTRVLTSRIANLVVNEGVPPSEILAVTFTNKAAAEIKERLKKLIGARSDKLWTGTFHTIGLNILRAENELIGHKKGLTIYDDEEQGMLIRLVMSELGISEKRAPYKAVQFEINMARNENLTPSEYAQNAKSNLSGEVHAVFPCLRKETQGSRCRGLRQPDMRTHSTPSPTIPQPLRGTQVGLGTYLWMSTRIPTPLSTG